MKKIIILTLMLISFGWKMYAQSLVIDPAMIGIIYQVSDNEQNAYKDIKENQSEIKTYQFLINAQLNKIREIEQKTADYLSTVQAVVKNGKDIVYASSIVSDVVKYQSKVMDVAQGDPELIVVGLKTEYELVTRGLEVVQYIYTFALQDGEHNMLDNKERSDMVLYVIKELRTMRGLSYSVYRQMKTAKREEVMRNLDVRNFKY